MAAFDYDIQFVSSKQNTVAYTLSRLPLSSVGATNEEVFHVEEKQLDSLPITSKEIRNATRADPVLSRVLQFLRSGWPISVQDEHLKPYCNRKYEFTVEQDCILRGLRVVIPKRYQAPILEELHMSHPGIVRMKEIARSFVWWPNCDKDIEITVCNCSKCQQVNSISTYTMVLACYTMDKSTYRLRGAWKTEFSYSSRCSLTLARDISYAEYH